MDIKRYSSYAIGMLVEILLVIAIMIIAYVIGAVIVRL